MNKIRKYFNFDILIILCCICIITPIVLVGIYNRPAADDYGYSILTRQAVINGGNIIDIISAGWKTNIQFYNTWQGLYTSAFLLSFQPAIFGEKLYGLTTVIMITVTFVPLLLSVFIINKHFFKASRLSAVSLSAVLYTVIALWMPSANQGLYWFNGAMNYMPWAFTNVLLLCMLIDVYLTTRPASGSPDSKKAYSIRSIVYITICTLLAFITSGANHVTAFENILLLVIVTMFLLFKKRFYSLPPLAAAVIGFAIMYMAPGTALRQGHLTASSGIVSTVMHTAVYIFEFYGTYLNFAWLLSLVAVTPVFTDIIHKRRFNVSAAHIFAVFICANLVICGMLCVPYHAGSAFGAPRLTNVIWITFMFFSWLLYFLVLSFAVKKQIINTSAATECKFFKLKKTVAVIFCLAFLVCGVSNSVPSTTRQAAAELFMGFPQQYAAQMDARFEICNDPDIKEAALPALTTTSYLLYSGDFGTDPYTWPNDTVTQYYNKPVYVVEESVS